MQSANHPAAAAPDKAVPIMIPTPILAPVLRACLLLQSPAAVVDTIEEIVDTDAEDVDAGHVVSTASLGCHVVAGVALVLVTMIVPLLNPTSELSCGLILQWQGLVHVVLTTKVE